jgi:hypothetical protein
MTQQTDIKRRADGSIDYTHYIAVSDVMRRRHLLRTQIIIMRVVKKTWIATKSPSLVRFVTNFSKTSQTAR